MKKIAFYFIIASLLFAGCNNTEETDYAKAINGTWICDYVDNVPLLTNQIFVLTFNTDKSAVFAQGIEYSDGTKEWIDGKGFSYIIADNIITITGKNSNETEIYMELAINSITETVLTYYVQKMTIDGITQNDESLYKLTKADYTDNNAVIGIWKGGEVSPNTQVNDYYWNLKSDGTYDFYYFDEEIGKYVVKNDNQGTYYYYKDNIVFNWVNDLTTATLGKTYEVWHISTLNSYNMGWIGKRENGVIITYSLFHADNLPNLE